MKTKQLVHGFAIAAILLSVTSQLQAQTQTTVKKAQDTLTQNETPVFAPPRIIKEEDEENEIFEKVDIEPSVDLRLWRKHLETYLLTYIENAAKKNMPPGKYTVNVRFLVEKDGSIKEVKALNDPGYGLAEGAVKVVKTGPKWKPGEQNGRKVKSYHTQPIIFVIQDK